jgi:act minimal PKS acyl carrier protein
MQLFTVDQLRDIMGSCVKDDDYELGAGRLDAPFAELDFDSLAVLEIATRIQQDYGVPFPDEAVERMRTPRHVLDYVNDRLAMV